MWGCFMAVNVEQSVNTCGGAVEWCIETEMPRFVLTCGCVYVGWNEIVWSGVT